MVAPDFVNRGRMLTADGRHLEAVKVCRLGLLAQPAALEGRVVLAEALLALARFDEVLAEVRVILQTQPQLESALRLKAEALLGRGDAAQALDIFERLSLTSADPTLAGRVEVARERASHSTTATLGDDDTSISWTRDYPSHLADSDSVTDHFDNHAARAAHFRPAHQRAGAGAPYGASAAGSAPVYKDAPTTLPADDATEIEEPSFAMATADTMLVTSPADPLGPGGLDFDARIAAAEPDVLTPRRSSIGSARRAKLPTPHREPLASDVSSGSIELSVADLEPITSASEADGINMSLDASSEELSIADLIPATDSSALAVNVAQRSDDQGIPIASQLPGGQEDVRGFDSEHPGTPSDPTHAYGPERHGQLPSEQFPAEAPLFLEREPERPKSRSFPTDLPRPVLDPSMEIEPQMTVPETPRARQPARERPSAPLNLEPVAPAIDNLFPEDEDGVSKLSIIDPVSGVAHTFEKGPAHQRPRPPEIIDVARPDLEEPIRFGDGGPGGDGGPLEERPNSRHDDMRMIRAGLGLAPDPSRQQMRLPVESAPVGPPPSAPVRAAPPTARVAPHIPRVAERRVRRGLSMPLIIGLAVLLVGGGVAGGVMLRTWRTEQGVNAAAARAAELSATGSYLDLLRARSLLDRALELKARPDIARQRARVGATLSAEFGVAETAPQVIDAKDTSPEAVTVRVYRALAAGNAVVALAEANAYLKVAPKSLDATYLRGLALADLGQLEAAARALKPAAAANPLARAHLANVLRLSGAPAAAAKQAGDGELPAVIIARARALARAGELPDGDDPEKTLQELVAEGTAPPAEQRRGVSPSQSLDARLALIEIAIARGKSDLARSQLLALANLELDAGAPFRLAYAQALLRTGDADAAADQLALIQAAWPTSPRTHILAARILLAGGDRRAARAEIEKIASVESHPRALAVRGQLALEGGRLDAARADLDKALTASPGLEDAILARARLDLASGDADKALARIEALPAGLFGGARDILKARALRAAGRLEEARATLAGAASAGAVEGLIELARLEAAGGHRQEAITAYDKVLAKYPKNVPATLERAVLLLDSGKSVEARKILDALAAERANDPQVLLAAARARTLLGDAGAATPLIDGAAQIPGAPKAIVARERGRALLRQRIYEGAKTELTASLAADPTDAETTILLMEVYLGLADADGAAALIKSARGPLNGRTHEMSLLSGIRSLIIEKSEEAETDFLAARGSLPKSSSARARAMINYWLGRSYEINGKLPAARRALLVAIRFEPTMGRAFLALGDVQLQDRKVRDAEKRYKVASELDPVANPRAFLQLGQLYVSSSRPRQAKAALEQYLELDPNGPGVNEAKELLAKIR